jgi:hypothetical protein
MKSPNVILLVTVNAVGETAQSRRLTEVQAVRKIRASQAGPIAIKKALRAARAA